MDDKEVIIPEELIKPVLAEVGSLRESDIDPWDEETRMDWKEKNEFIKPLPPGAVFFYCLH